MLKRDTLIYDQDCGFCQRSIDNLRRIIGERIDYLGRSEFQNGDFGISQTDSLKAIQFIELEGKKVYSAAAAIFKALSLKPGWGFYYWLYQYLPGFAIISEAVYRVIARYRTEISSCKTN